MYKYLIIIALVASAIFGTTACKKGDSNAASKSATDSTKTAAKKEKKNPTKPGADVKAKEKKDAAKSKSGAELVDPKKTTHKKEYEAVASSDTAWALTSVSFDGKTASVEDILNSGEPSMNMFAIVLYFTPEGQYYQYNYVTEKWESGWWAVDKDFKNIVFDAGTDEEETFALTINGENSVSMSMKDPSGKEAKLDFTAFKF